jgi:replicative DNA helicase
MGMKEGRQFLEEVIIGSCLNEKPAYDMVKDILIPGDFTKPRNLIYTAFVRLSEEKTPIDLVTTHRLLQRKKQPVTPYYLADCTTRVNSPENLQHHSLILLQYSLEDELCEMLVKFTKQGGLEGEYATNCFQKISEKPDILETKDLLVAYMNKRMPDSQMTKELNNIHDKFEKRCSKIRLALS